MTTHSTPEFHTVTVSAFSRLTGEIFADVTVNADDTVQVSVNHRAFTAELKLSGYTHVEYFVLPYGILFMNATTQEVN